MTHQMRKLLQYAAMDLQYLLQIGLDSNAWEWMNEHPGSEVTKTLHDIRGGRE
jgi:hypothetical protein